MKKIFLIVWLFCSLGLTFAADTCQWNICINGSGDIYLKDSETIYSEILSGTTTTGSTSSGSITTWSTLNNTTGTTTTTTNNTVRVFNNWNEELDAAISRGNQNWLTMYNTITDYKADNLVLREEAAKLFYKAALTIDYTGTPYANCTFSDIASVSDSLKENIQNICALWWLMKGHEGLFSPFANLTYAEAITVIARMANIKNTETTSARRTPYLTYIKNINILSKTNINENTMETKITRWEIIVLLYRIALKYQQSGWNLNSLWEGNTTLLPSDSNSSNSLVSIGAGVIDTPKFTTALLWMYNADMTMYWKASDYDPFNITTRAQTAKLLSIYNKKFIPATGSVIDTCTYTDIESSSLKEYINDACQQGIFKNTTTFNPNDAILKSEFVTAILNMLKEQPNVGDTIASKALELEIISKADLTTFDKPITRYEVALLLSNLHLKTEFIKNLKETTSNYNVIAPISKDTTVYPDGQQKVFIDVHSIDSKEFNNGFISILGNSYKIKKKEVINYLPTSYSRYGEISDITNDSQIGSISLAIGQKGWTKALIEWFIAFPDSKEIYSIYPTEQIPYYMITKIK